MKSPTVLRAEDSKHDVQRTEAGTNRGAKRRTRQPETRLRLELLEGRELLSATYPLPAADVSHNPTARPEAGAVSPPDVNAGAQPYLVDPRGNLSNGQFPAVGMVGYGSTRSYCTGTLVARNFVLTAAHCVWNYQTGRTYAPSAMSFTVAGPGGRVLKGTQIYIDTRFRGSIGSDTSGDIALIKLDGSVSNVTPMRVSSSTPWVGQGLYLAGFGNTGRGGTGEVNGTGGVKRWGYSWVNYVSAGLVWDRFDRGESATAHGDSGGPQLSCDRYFNCSVVSITSGGTGTSYGSWHNNTRVDPYAASINQIIRRGYSAHTAGRGSPKLVAVTPASPRDNRVVLPTIVASSQAMAGTQVTTSTVAADASPTDIREAPVARNTVQTGARVSRIASPAKSVVQETAPHHNAMDHLLATHALSGRTIHFDVDLN